MSWRPRHTCVVLSTLTCLAGPLLDDAEKDRLAEWMRYRGKPPERKAAIQQQQPHVRQGSNFELQSLFDQHQLGLASPTRSRVKERASRQAGRRAAYLMRVSLDSINACLARSALPDTMCRI